MTINLNKQVLNKQNLLKYIQDIDVYKYYIDEEIVNFKSMKSPLRNDDNPSFGFFISKDNDLCFNDFLIGGGDFVRFVQLKLKLNYYDALNQICIDFNLNDYFFCDEKMPKSSTKPLNKTKDRHDIIEKINNFILQKKVRDWKLYDIQYWLEYGIDYDTLVKYNVEPLDYIFLNNTIVKADKYAYCFTEFKDNLETYKVYQPFNNKYKWINNHDYSVWQGWSQMPEKGQTLIITKSLKDVMAIVNTTSFHSVSLQAESVHPKTNIINELKSRFEDIFLLYDNDYNKITNWGQKYAEKLSNEHELFNIKIEDLMYSKDYTDLIKKIGMKEASQYLNKLITNYLPF